MNKQVVCWDLKKAKEKRQLKYCPRKSRKFHAPLLRFRAASFREPFLQNIYKSLINP